MQAQLFRYPVRRELPMALLPTAELSSFRRLPRWAVSAKMIAGSCRSELRPSIVVWQQSYIYRHCCWGGYRNVDYVYGTIHKFRTGLFFFRLRNVPNSRGRKLRQLGLSLRKTRWRGRDQRAPRGPALGQRRSRGWTSAVCADCPRAMIGDPSEIAPCCCAFLREQSYRKHPVQLTVNTIIESATAARQQGASSLHHQGNRTASTHAHSSIRVLECPLKGIRFVEVVVSCSNLWDRKHALLSLLYSFRPKDVSVALWSQQKEGRWAASDSSHTPSGIVNGKIGGDG